MTSTIVYIACSYKQKQQWTRATMFNLNMMLQSKLAPGPAVSHHSGPTTYLFTQQHPKPHIEFRGRPDQRERMLCKDHHSPPAIAFGFSAHWDALTRLSYVYTTCGTRFTYAKHDYASYSKFTPHWSLRLCKLYALVTDTIFRPLDTWEVPAARFSLGSPL